MEGRWGDGARRESGDQKDEHVFSLVLIQTLSGSFCAMHSLCGYI